MLSHLISLLIALSITKFSLNCELVVLHDCRLLRLVLQNDGVATDENAVACHVDMPVWRVIYRGSGCFEGSYVVHLLGGSQQAKPGNSVTTR